MGRRELPGLVSVSPAANSAQAVQLQRGPVSIATTLGAPLYSILKMGEGTHHGYQVQ